MEKRQNYIFVIIDVDVIGKRQHAFDVIGKRQNDVDVIEHIMS